MFVYFFDVKFPAAKLPEVLTWANAVNRNYAVGAIHVLTEDRQIRCYHGMDFEDAEFEPQHIQNMFHLMTSLMEYRLPQFMAICFGGKSAEKALEIEPE